MFFKIKALKNELNNLEKSNVEKTNKFDQFEKEIAKFKEIENYLNDNLNETKKELNDVIFIFYISNFKLFILIKVLFLD